MTPLEQIEKALAEMEAREKALLGPKPRDGKVTISVEPRTVSELYVLASHLPKLIAALRKSLEALDSECSSGRFLESWVADIAKALTGEGDR
jgi:hypothetical protein